MGTILRAPGEPLVIPAHAGDGGEEAEMAGVLPGSGPTDGPGALEWPPATNSPNHVCVFEKQNYLNLAGSKIRTCAIGPELTVSAPFQTVPGRARIERDGRELWAKDICTGENEMTQLSLCSNLEHHHFKFENPHRRVPVMFMFTFLARIVSVLATMFT